MKVQYINSYGDVIDLLNFNTRMKDANFHDYEWEYDSIEQQYGIDITRFRKTAKEYEATIVFKGDLDTRKRNLNRFFEIAEKDIIDKNPGKIIWDDYYINAYAVSSSTYPNDDSGWTQKDVIFLCPYPFWIAEESRSFPPIEQSVASDEYLDYEYDYEYVYSTPTDGSAIWEVDHFAPCEFLMTIFGPVSNPRILINGYPYEVYTELGSNDYLQIDSRNNKVIKYLSNGTRQDMYNYRAKQQSIFEPITPGNITVMWPGTYGFDLTLFCERSEPKWKMKSS